MTTGRHIDGELYMRIWDVNKSEKTLGIINRRYCDPLPKIPKHLRKGRKCCICGEPAVYSDALHYIGRDRRRITLSESSRCYCQKCGDQRSDYLIKRDQEFNRIKIERSFESALEILEANHINPMTPEIAAAASRAQEKAISGERIIKSCQEAILSIFLETFFSWTELHTSVRIPKKSGGSDYELDVSMDEFHIGIEADGGFHSRAEEKLADRIKEAAKREWLSNRDGVPWMILRISEQELKKQTRDIDYILSDKWEKTKKALTENGCTLPTDFYGDISGNTDQYETLRMIRTILGDIIEDEIPQNVRNSIAGVLELISATIDNSDDERYTE